MTRRSTVNRERAKTRGRKTTRPKRSNAPAATRQVNLSVSDLREQLKRKRAGRDERAALAEGWMKQLK